MRPTLADCCDGAPAIAWAQTYVVPTARGTAIQHQIDMEAHTYSNPPTGQKERMLYVSDLAQIVVFSVLLWCAIETIRSLI